MKYSHRVEFTMYQWNPEISKWLYKNVNSDQWRRYKDPLDFGEDVDYMIFDFVNKEDATAFKLKFGV